VEYLTDLGLSGMCPESIAILLDDLLEADRVSAEGRSLLLMNHQRLAAEAQFYLLCPYEPDGLTFLSFKHGEYAYSIYDGEEFLEFLEQEPEHLNELTELVRRALFIRLEQDLGKLNIT
jgi:hypothetical protein